MAKSASKEHRIRWNGEERAALVAEGRKVIAATPMKPLAALAVAQRILPRGRRRQVPTVAKVGWFVKGLGPAVAAASASRHVAGAPPAAHDERSIGSLKGTLVSFFADVFEEALEEVRARHDTARPAMRPAAKRRT